MAEVDTEVIETKESIINAAVAAAEAEGTEGTESTEATETTTQEPSVAELRQAAGDTAEGLSDEELRAEWKKAQEEPEQKFTLPNGLKLYGEDGKEFTDFEKVTLAQLLSDKVQWGYNALGKEQKKALTEVFRNASLGHYNEQKMATLADERQRAYEMYKELKTEHDTWGKDRQVWLGVLTAASQGNIEPLKQLLKTYQESSASGLEQPQAQPESAEWNQAGMQWVTTEANRIAEQFGANPLEIAQAIVHLAEQEPAEFLTQEKLNAIVQYEIPALLERHNYAKTQTAPDPRDAEIAAMKKQLAELTAGKENAVTQKVRDKLKKVPVAGGGRAPAAGDSVPTFKSREDYKRWIRGEDA